MLWSTTETTQWIDWPPFPEGCIYVDNRPLQAKDPFLDPSLYDPHWRVQAWASPGVPRVDPCAVEPVGPRWRDYQRRR